MLLSSFGFGGYSGTASIVNERASSISSPRGGFNSNAGVGGDVSMMKLDHQQSSLSSFAGASVFGERLMRAIGLAAKPNQQSKKKGLEQMVEVLSKERKRWVLGVVVSGERARTTTAKKKKKNEEIEVIVSDALPMWTRVHSKCLRNEKSGGTTTDEARLLSVKVHNLMCERSGKRLAKCIGTTSAIPLILLARCDGDKNVAKEAETGFRRIFTTKMRRAKALRFVAVDFSNWCESQCTER